MDNEDSKQLICLDCLRTSMQTCQISNFDLDSQLYPLHGEATSVSEVLVKTAWDRTRCRHPLWRGLGCATTIAPIERRRSIEVRHSDMFDVDSLVQLVPSRWWPLVVAQWPLFGAKGWVMMEMETGDLCNKVMDGTDLSCKRLESAARLMSQNITEWYRTQWCWRRKKKMRTTNGHDRFFSCTSSYHLGVCNNKMRSEITCSHCNVLISGLTRVRLIFSVLLLQIQSISKPFDSSMNTQAANAQAYQALSSKCVVAWQICKGCLLVLLREDSNQQKPTRGRPRE